MADLAPARVKLYTAEAVRLGTDARPYQYDLADFVICVGD
jgi:hypothetical protein